RVEGSLQISQVWFGIKDCGQFRQATFGYANGVVDGHIIGQAEREDICYPDSALACIPRCSYFRLGRLTKMMRLFISRYDLVQIDGVIGHPGCMEGSSPDEASEADAALCFRWIARPGGIAYV